MMLHYHDITKYDMLNGEGLRTVLWLSGCEHACKGCQNPQTWNRTSGIEFDLKALTEVLTSLKDEAVDGLTLSGGDPLATYNREEITTIVKMIRHFYPNKTIWVYTGFTYEEVKELPIMGYIDVLVDGKFDQMNREKTPNVKWRGDSSQKIIDVKKTREQNIIVERLDLY